MDMIAEMIDDYWEEKDRCKLIPILRTNCEDEKCKMELDEEALKSIFQRPDVADSPIMIVSVSGAFRKGKSFLLNFFLRYLKNKGHLNPTNWLGDEDVNDGFEWRGGKTAYTQGILIYDDVFFIEKDNQKIAVLLMDTQGLFDNNSDKQLCTQIFAFSTLLSSVQVFNLSHQIQENDLEYLQCFTEYAKLAQKTIRSKQPPFQKLMFVIRDWQELDDHDWGLDSGGDDSYLSGVLSCASNNRELTAIRTHLRDSFNELQCFLMPHPGLRVSIWRPTNPFAGAIRDISPEFIEEVQTLGDTLLNPKNAVIKKIHGRPITGNSFLNYAISCSRCFVHGHLPKPQTMMESASDVMNLQALKSCVEQYAEKMERKCNNMFLREKELRRHHETTSREILQEFDASTSFGQQQGNHEAYRGNLRESLQLHYEVFMAKNLANKKEIEHEVREDGNYMIKKYVWKIEELTKNKVLDQDAFSKLHEETKQQFISEFVSKHRKKTGFEESLKILQTDLAFSYAVLKRINDDKRGFNQSQKYKAGNQLKVQNLMNTCLEYYIKEIGKYSEKHVNSDDLIERHTEIRQETLKKFTSHLRELKCSDSQEFMNQLSQKIQEHFSYAEAKNETYRKMMQLILNQQKYKIIPQYKSIMLEGTKKHYVAPKVLEETHTKTELFLLNKVVTCSDVAKLSEKPIMDTVVWQATEDLKTELRSMYKDVRDANERNKPLYMQTAANLRSIFPWFRRTEK